MAKKKPIDEPALEPVLTIDPDADPPAEAIPDHVRRDIIGLFASGKPVAAMRRYREHTDCDLATARDVVLEMAADQPIPEGWEPPGVDAPPLSPEEQVVFPPEEGWRDGDNVVSLPRPKRQRPELTIAPAPTGPPPDKVIKTSEESRRFPLSEEDLAARRDQLTMLTMDAEAMKLRHKMQRATITEERKAHEARISTVAHEINDKAETRDVTVVYTARYADGVVVETIKETGEVLGSKPLAGPDAQVPLFGGAANAPADTATDTDTDEAPPPTDGDAPPDVN